MGHPIFLVVSTVLTTAQVGLDERQLSAILESSYEAFEDVRFEYEGAEYMPRKNYRENFKLGDDGRYKIVSGTFVFRRDGATLDDAFHRIAPKNELFRRTIATLGNKTEKYERFDESKTGGGEIRHDAEDTHDIDGSIGRFFLVHRLRSWIRYPKKQLIHGGTEMIDGHRCEVISFLWGRDMDLIDRYWIDLERGGFPIKRERLQHGAKTVTARTTIDLGQFPVKPGKSIWLPRHGVHKIDPDSSEGPSTIEEISMLPISLRINAHPPDSLFTVKFRAGTPVTDTLRRVQFEWGQDRRPVAISHAQAEDRLKEHLREAEAQGDELKASSTARGGRGTEAWLPWVIALTALAVLGGVVIRRRVG